MRGGEEDRMARGVRKCVVRQRRMCDRMEVRGRETLQRVWAQVRGDLAVRVEVGQRLSCVEGYAGA